MSNRNSPYSTIREEGNFEKEVWNRTGDILQLVTTCHRLLIEGDARNDLNMMYHGVQGILDIITSDFIERYDAEGNILKHNSPAKQKKILHGFETKKFREYRQRLDMARRFEMLSKTGGFEFNYSQNLKNKSYQLYQGLKYDLFQEMEYLGYNAKIQDRSDVYREGNQ